MDNASSGAGEMQVSLLRQSIQNGLHFLATRQCPSGAWEAVYALKKEFPNNLKPLTEVFSVAYILREIAPFAAQFYPAQEMLQRACDFLDEQRRVDGLWKFYRKGDMRLLPNDFDTTACTASALILAGRQPDLAPVIEKLHAHQHPDGGYWTYAMPPKAPPKNWMYPIYENVYPEYTLNAHILYFLVVSGQDYQTQANFLLEALYKHDYERPQFFYDSPLLFLYNLSKALEATPLWQPSLYTEIERQTREHFSHEAAPILEMALALGILKRCRSYEDSQAFIKKILQAQLEDGGWDLEYYFTSVTMVHGCREVVTAIVLNVLYTMINTETS
jgi:hypothetical protein